MFSLSRGGGDYAEPKNASSSHRTAHLDDIFSRPHQSTGNNAAQMDMLRAGEHWDDGVAAAAAPDVNENELYRVDDTDFVTLPMTVGGEGPSDYSRGAAATRRGEESTALKDPELAAVLAGVTSKAARRQLIAKWEQGKLTETISSDQVLHQAPGLEAGSMYGLRIAMGADYEKKVRAEAGPAPSREERRKHQIRSLYYDAKMAELEMMDMAAKGGAGKANTAAKYGW